MRAIGKKGLEWQRERRRLIKEGIASGVLIKDAEGHILAFCKDCKHFHNVTPDHRIERSQGGKHTQKNIDWVCCEPPCNCHIKRDQMGDKQNKKQVKNKKADWMQLHKCKSCKAKIAFLLCPNCGQMSV